MFIHLVFQRCLVALYKIDFFSVALYAIWVFLYQLSKEKMKKKQKYALASNDKNKHKSNNNSSIKEKKSNYFLILYNFLKLFIGHRDILYMHSTMTLLILHHQAQTTSCIITTPCQAVLHQFRISLSIGRLDK